MNLKSNKRLTWTAFALTCAGLLGACNYADPEDIVDIDCDEEGAAETYPEICKPNPEPEPEPETDTETATFTDIEHQGRPLVALTSNNSKAFHNGEKVSGMAHGELLEVRADWLCQRMGMVKNVGFSFEYIGRDAGYIDWYANSTYAIPNPRSPVEAFLVQPNLAIDSIMVGEQRERIPSTPGFTKPVSYVPAKFTSISCLLPFSVAPSKIPSFKDLMGGMPEFRYTFDLEDVGIELPSQAIDPSFSADASICITLGGGKKVEECTSARIANRSLETPPSIRFSSVLRIDSSDASSVSLTVGELSKRLEYSSAEFERTNVAADGTPLPFKRGEVKVAFKNAKFVFSEDDVRSEAFLAGTLPVRAFSFPMSGSTALPPGVTADLSTPARLCLKLNKVWQSGSECSAVELSQGEFSATAHGRHALLPTPELITAVRLVIGERAIGGSLIPLTGADGKIESAEARFNVSLADLHSSEIQSAPIPRFERTFAIEGQIETQEEIPDEALNTTATLCASLEHRAITPCRSVQVRDGAFSASVKVQDIVLSLPDSLGGVTLQIGSQVLQAASIEAFTDDAQASSYPVAVGYNVSASEFSQIQAELQAPYFSDIRLVGQATTVEPVAYPLNALGTACVRWKTTRMVPREQCYPVYAANGAFEIAVQGAAFVLPGVSEIERVRLTFGNVSADASLTVLSPVIQELIEGSSRTRVAYELAADFRFHLSQDFESFFMALQSGVKFTGVTFGGKRFVAINGHEMADAYDTWTERASERADALCRAVGFQGSLAHTAQFPGAGAPVTTAPSTELLTEDAQTLLGSSIVPVHLSSEIRMCTVGSCVNRYNFAVFTSLTCRVETIDPALDGTPFEELLEQTGM